MKEINISVKKDGENWKIIESRKIDNKENANQILDKYMSEYDSYTTSEDGKYISAFKGDNKPDLYKIEEKLIDLKLEDLFELLNLDEDDIYEIEERLENEFNDIDSFEIGYLSVEDQANSGKNGVYPDMARYTSISINNKEYGLCYVDSDEYYRVFDSLNDAKEYANSLENTGYISLEKLISNFEEKSGCEVNVKNTRNHGYFVNYEIYFENKLILDNIYELNDDLIESINEIKSLIDEVCYEKDDIKIRLEEIKSEKHNFEKIYIFTFEDDKYNTVTQEVSVLGSQGESRNLKDVMDNHVDFDQLVDEFKEIRSVSSFSLAGLEKKQLEVDKKKNQSEKTISKQENQVGME